MSIRNLRFAAISIGSFLMPLVASAEGEPIFENIDDVVSKACTLVNWIFTGALILTIVFVLLAAIKYITKGSDPKEISTAHQMLIWAAVGFAVALVAAVVPNFVASTLGTSITDPCV